MTQVLTVDQPRFDLDCPPGIQVPGPASLELLKYLFSVRGKTVLDLGCGPGLFAIAAAKLGAAEVWATDADRAAVDATRRNAERNGVDVVAKRGELFEAVDGRTFDLIVTVCGPGSYEETLRQAPEVLDGGGELLTCFPVLEETPRFESLLRERFRFRQLPEGRNGTPVRSYLAMKL